MSDLRRFRDEDTGAILVMAAILLVMLLIIAAFVIDLGGVRSLRAANQTVADSAAAAAAITAAETADGREVCETAKAYLALNTDLTLSGINCSASFSTPCIAGITESATTTEDGVTVTIEYPVADGSPFMASRQTGAPAQPTSPSDGTPCDRVGVAVESDWEGALSPVIGVDSLAADVHSVAMASGFGGDSVPLNLLVLERTGCPTLKSSGQGGIIVETIYVADLDGDPLTIDPAILPGLAASDSDGSDGCSLDGVIDVDGSDAIIRSDGPSCASQTGTYPHPGDPSLIVGEGCGLIQTLAPGTPGCNPPACTSGPVGPNPDPTALPGRLTRAPIDHRYNCWGNYASLPSGVDWATSALTSPEQDIDGCTSGTDDHIYDLIADVGETGPPSGFTGVWSNHHPCTIEGPPDTVISVSGDWYVDCYPLIVKRTVTFSDGNVVLAGGVLVESTGSLTVTDPTEAWVFLRGGTFYKAGQASLDLNNVTVYASRTVTEFNLEGGSGSLDWVAPDTGDFDDLALWSDSESMHEWAGQAELTLEGVFFTPWADVEYAGQGAQQQVSAQFISQTLHARGQGAIALRPEEGRSVEFPSTYQSVLIR